MCSSLSVRDRAFDGVARNGRGVPDCKRVSCGDFAPRVLTTAIGLWFIALRCIVPRFNGTTRWIRRSVERQLIGGRTREKDRACNNCGDCLVVLVPDFERCNRGGPSSKYAISAQTIPLPWKITQRRFAITLKLCACIPDNALAHYHLGFALGMVGDRMAELKEYRRAAALGLVSWDLFLNLGLAQLETGDLDAATDSISTCGVPWRGLFRVTFQSRRRR